MQDSEKDHHNFSNSSSHRLPTISGTQAVRNAIRNSRPIPTGLPSLDIILDSHASIERTQRGLRRGIVTEVFGPPGVGKTTFAIQAAVNALRSSSEDDSKVVWIDTASQLLPGRLQQVLEGHGQSLNEELSSSLPQPVHIAEQATLQQPRATHLRITNLPSLLVLFMHPVANFPPPDTSLIILDDLSNFVLSSLPKSAAIDPRDATTRGKGTTPSVIRNDNAAKQTVARRFQIVSSLASALQAFAATHNLSILVTSKVTVSLKAGQKAALRPALSSQQWDTCLGTRILLYQDFWNGNLPSDKIDPGEGEPNGHITNDHLKTRNIRFTKVLRLNGKEVSSPEVGFLIDRGGLREILGPSSQVRPSMLPLATQPFPDLDNPDLDGVGYDSAVSPNGNLQQAVEPAPVAQPDDHVSEPGLGPDQTKRKAIEISDSEDNDEHETRAALSPSPSLPPDSSFRPASQADQNTEQEISGSQTVKRLRLEQAAPDIGVDSFQIESSAPDGNEDMLLDKFEAHRAPFSQAAADMSDPLTPSDHVEPSP